MKREYAVLCNVREVGYVVDSDVTYSIIFKDPEDKYWSLYLPDVPSRDTADEIAEAMNR